MKTEKLETFEATVNQTTKRFTESLTLKSLFVGYFFGCSLLSICLCRNIYRCLVSLHEGRASAVRSARNDYDDPQISSLVI